MKYLKFTYVDAVTGISVASHPAANGPVFPAVKGLEYAWARESQYPTEVPEFFGTCPDDADTQIDGVLGVYLQADWETMREDEMRARNPVPASVSPRQIRQAMSRTPYGQGTLRDAVEAAVAAGDRDLRDWWEFSTVVERSNPQVVAMAAALGMDDAALDDLWRLAATL